jgi:uncharacterized protein (TIGR03435 family)
MDLFAQGLRGMSFALNKSVANGTGLKGLWNFDLKWRGPENISIFEAIEHQLGLKLQPQNISQPVIIVDSVNKKPTANVPDIADRVPPAPPASFDVAAVKPSMPGVTQGIKTQPGGRLDIQGFTLRMMIRFAWNINSDEMLANAPKFLDDTRFDIAAQASAANGGKSDSAIVDFDDFRPMLRALLEDRFKLATHIENRPVTVYRLLATKPKLRKADASNRAGCREGPGADGSDPRVAAPWLARLLTCQNVTMAEFAERIPFWAGDYVNSPVVDGTGLKGEFDLTLSFSPKGLLESANQATRSTGDASSPVPHLSFLDALNRQVGLTLKAEKRPAPVIVIDRIEDRPTSN